MVNCFDADCKHTNESHTYFFSALQTRKVNCFGIVGEKHNYVIRSERPQCLV